MCTTRRSGCSHHKINVKVRSLFKPKMLVIIALLVCWNIRNSVVVGIHHHVSGNGVPYQHRQHNHHANINARLRAPSSFNQPSEPMLLSFGGAGITLSDETALVGPVVRSSLQQPPLLDSQPTNPDGLIEPRRKKDCGEPSIATRGLLGPTLKRSFFAFTQDEVDQKVRDDEYRETSERRKRDVQQQLLEKRTATGGGSETQDSPLPWTCETKYEWKDMGADHYPRFVRTAECKSRLCFNGFFRCRPRRYKTKVLKRITPTDSTSCEDDDVSLPETLRTNWKFITVTINLCCDCTGRIPGNTEV